MDVSGGSSDTDACESASGMDVCESAIDMNVCESAIDTNVTTTSERALVIGDGRALRIGRAASQANHTRTVILDMAGQSTSCSSLGIQLQKRREYVQVHNKPSRNTPAYKAGIKANDVIVAIENEGRTVNKI